MPRPRPPWGDRRLPLPLERFVQRPRRSGLVLTSFGRSARPARAARRDPKKPGQRLIERPRSTSDLDGSPAAIADHQPAPPVYSRS